MIRILTTTLLLAACTSSAFARPAPQPDTLLNEARTELVGLQGQLGQITQPRIRLKMANKILRVEGLIHQVERTLEGKSAITVEKAIADVEAQPYDNDKLAVISDLSNNGRFTSREIAQIVSSCAFDSTRVDALVALHPSVIDPDRYEIALSTLEFTSSRDRVSKALGLQEW